jgi:threonine synthase
MPRQVEVPPGRTMRLIWYCRTHSSQDVVPASATSPQEFSVDDFRADRPEPLSLTKLLPVEGHTGSTLVDLKGSLSGQIYAADRLIGTDPLDGRPLLAHYDLGVAAQLLTPETLALRSSGGLWRWREILPVREWNSVVTLGEGSCPLLPANRFGAAIGLRRLLIKTESLNPTGSFKARGMAVAVSRAVELGVTHVVAPSAGNAAGALASYAARAGINATLVMPVDAPFANQIEVLVQGGRLVLLEGLISDCGKLATLISQELGAFDLSTLKEPYRLEGKKTMGLELIEDLGWNVPDAIVYPTGGGTGLVGMWKAFDELEQMGLMDERRPRMIAVQAEGCAPIVRAFESGERFASPWENASTCAAGIRVPSAVGDFLILDAIRESGGSALTVDESSIVQMQEFMSARVGQFVGLETAAGAAALPHLLHSGRLSRDDRVVLFDTGSGFKSVSPQGLAIPLAVPNDPARWESVVAAITADYPEQSLRRRPNQPTI